MGDTLLFGAAVAAITESVGIGTAVLVPTFSHPVRVAEQIAMLDVLSGGRVMAGLGRGYQQREFDGYGVPQNESKARFREATAIIEGLLTTERFTYEGEFWQVKDLTIAPMPLQNPRPPVYIAATATPETLDWIVEKDYRCLTGNPYSLDPDSSYQVGSILKDVQARHGRTPSLEHTWGLIHNIFVADTDEEAAEIFRPNWQVGNDYLYHYARVVEPGQPLPDDYKAYELQDKALDSIHQTDYEDVLAARGTLVGSPDTVAEKFAALYEATGFTKQLMWMNRGGAVDQALMLRSMELFATEVMPQIRDLGTAPVAELEAVTSW
jgi:alkanesulfonate monooxygenase SsuD/methylene tetrahydromethanopterin reductase-like flavin-dependent oxidoreductase (luciferase family)